MSDKILEETKLSTFITLAHALEVHPLMLIRQYFHALELPVWSTKGTKYANAVTFRAPPQPGTMISYWKMVDAQGELCFPTMAG